MATVPDNNPSSGKMSIESSALAALTDVLWEKQRKLILVVGAGVTLNATMEETGKHLAELTWNGLVRSGLDHLSQLPHFEQYNDRLDHAYRALERNTEASLMDAINIMKSLMVQEGELSSWLNLTFSALKVHQPAILDVLRDLHKEGAILVTTNYDHVLDQHCRLDPISPSDNPDDIKNFKSGHLDGVFHLHGSFRRPESVVLDTTDYYRIVNSETRKMLEKFFEFDTVLFIGCGSGLKDPNFGPLLSWMKEYLQNMEKRHCILTTERDKTDYRPLRSLRYGPDYADMAKYLRTLMDPHPHLRRRLFREFSSYSPNDTGWKSVHEIWKHPSWPRASRNWLGGTYLSQFPPQYGTSTILTSVKIDHELHDISWEIQVRDSPFYLGQHKGKLKISSYPFQVPVIYWETPLYSPFIVGSGASSPFDLGEWSPAYTLLQFLQTVANFLILHPLCEEKPYNNWPDHVPYKFHYGPSIGLEETKIKENKDKISIIASFFSRAYNCGDIRRSTNPMVDDGQREASIAAITAVKELYGLRTELNTIEEAFPRNMSNEEWISQEQKWADWICSECYLKVQKARRL
ncbi:SIR2-like domain-containing protein [Aspergillus transmontanensis]|uniref:Protein FAM118B n=1 Tax=Aspergillus transmontanensis TaxID=1034304 RepID=A0A5N6VD55_9EURO|nr:SIR2-like domain-containing protein [Aspergillus transmontanensis]